MSQKKLTLKLWSEQNRPREKLIYKVAKSLSNAELLEITLLDHIIVGQNTYFSFADEQEL
jgi:DNA repair protein RadC